MTLIAVSILPEAASEIDDALRRAASAVRAGAALVEWRVDRLADEPDAPVVIARLLERSPAPAIVTCRPTWEGGEYDGEEADRVSLLEAIGSGASAPRYLDVELAALQRSANLRQKVLLVVDHPSQPKEVTTGLVLSTHDFDGRPADLVRRLGTMAEEPAAAVLKVAWTARSLRDNLEAFELLRQRVKPTIALCMGPFGVMSRVLAPKFGGFLTFAADDEGVGTAPGQPTVKDLKDVYRVDRIGPATGVYGVIGWPVAHSLSPLVHNAAFAALDHDGVDVPMPVAPGWEPFKASVGAMLDDEAFDLRGASVTAPHKEHLVRFVRESGGEIDRDVEVMGAANTLTVRPDGSLRASNTDAPAAVSALLDESGLSRDEVARSRVAVLGAGGVARAVARGLSDLGARVVVVGRDPARAERLAADLDGAPTSTGGAARVTVGRTEDLGCGCFPIIVNCTPVGMAGGPAPDESPLPDEVPIDDSITIFDTVYAPAVTPLLAEARARGARVVGGLGMFLHQAALQSRLWCPNDGDPRPAMEAALARARGDDSRPPTLDAPA